MTQNNKCGKCKFFLIDDIKTYICTYHNCNVQSYGDKACNAFEKYTMGDDINVIWYNSVHNLFIHYIKRINLYQQSLLPMSVINYEKNITYQIWKC